MTIPAERIQRLTDLAQESAREGKYDRSRRYVRLARRIAERKRLQLSTRLDRFACPACDVYLIPGRNARVRTRSGHVVVTCECGAQARYPYKD